MPSDRSIVTGLDGGGKGESGGESEVDSAIGGVLALRGSPIVGTGGEGLAVGIGARSCACSGFAVGFVRIGVHGEDISGVCAAQAAISTANRVFAHIYMQPNVEGRIVHPFSTTPIRGIPGG